MQILLYFLDYQNQHTNIGIVNSMPIPNQQNTITIPQPNYLKNISIYNNLRIF